MRAMFSTRRLHYRLIVTLLMIASAALLLNNTPVSRADAPLPNVAVYELSTTSPTIQQVSLHAPGSTTPAFVVPHGQYVTPNGHFAMAMPALGSYEVWNLQTGVKAANWASSFGKSAPVSMAVSPNGTYAAIASSSMVNPANWSIAVFNLTANTRYDFNGTASTTVMPQGSAVLQLLPTIIGWTGDESALILSTPVPFSGASTHLFFKMAMSGMTFTLNGTANNPIPPVTTLGADQQITQLVFSPDSTRVAFVYNNLNNAPVNFTPFADGPGPGLPPNGLKVIGLADGTVATIAQAAAGQGLIAPAWAPDGHKLYFGAGPFQNTPFPVNVHLFNFDFSSITITAGDALIGSDPAHTSISDMQVCADQVFMREISIVPGTAAVPSPSIVGRITSAPLTSLATHSDVYTTDPNALGPCVPAVTGTGSTGGSGGVVPSVPTLAGSIATLTPSATVVSAPVLPPAPIACVLAPQLTVGGLGIVTPGAANNVRSTPTIGSSLIGQIPSGQTFSVLAGPFCDTTSGYQYWQVNYNGLVGYTAEGKSTYLLLPYTAPPPVTPPPVTFTPSATITPTFQLIFITVVPPPIKITFTLLQLPAPIQLAPANGSVFSVYPRTTLLIWNTVPGAASYTVEVQYCPSANANLCATSTPLILKTGITTNSYLFNFVGAQPGRWRVQAVSAGGVAGYESPWWIFRYTQ